MLLNFRLVIIYLICLNTFLHAQQTFYGETPHVWDRGLNSIKVSEETKNYAQEDLICLTEETNFIFYSNSDQKIVKSIRFLINTEAGLEKLKNFSLPESYDLAYDAGYHKQGKKSKIKIPYIAHFKITSLAARKKKFNSWDDVPFKLKVDPIKWISMSGEFVKDEIFTFQFSDLKVGDFIEIFYEAEFGSTYGSNLFYFHQKYPKLYCEYNFIYKVEDRFADYAFILPVNINDSSITTNIETQKNHKIIRKTIQLNNVQSVNYPENSFESKQFPYVYADFRFYKIVTGSYPDGSNRQIEYDYIRPKNFEWLIIRDTTNNFTKIYDKQFASIRQFIAKMPSVTNDSTQVLFLKALCDTLNSFTYISANNLFYNKSDLYNLYSGDHLLKRRLAEHLVWKLTIDILNENKIQYYKVNIQDNRYGEHNMRYRANYSYENYLIALPVNNTFTYFVPRATGVSYFLNELPYYYEGSLASLAARNYQETDKNKQVNYFKLIKTHKGTSNENSRTENATVNFNSDSLVSYLSIKESLSGQFSTILRHYYLNTFIDSTISPHYFKKCTEKPKASNIKLKLSSKLTEYPFRHNFTCSEKITLDSKTQIGLKDWFSFTAPKNIINEPKHDFYFDFENTDTYNFLLNFSKSTEIVNTVEFDYNIDNETFSLLSSITKQNEASYLLKVELKIKQRKLLKEKSAELLKLTKALTEINNFTLKLK